MWFESVVDDPEGFSDSSGERRHLAILFSDIVNFTSRAERFEALASLVSLLNAYMNEMCGILYFLMQKARWTS